MWDTKQHTHRRAMERRSAKRTQKEQTKKHTHKNLCIQIMCSIAAFYTNFLFKKRKQLDRRTNTLLFTLASGMVSKFYFLKSYGFFKQMWGSEGEGERVNRVIYCDFVRKLIAGKRPITIRLYLMCVCVFVCECIDKVKDEAERSVIGAKDYCIFSIVWLDFIAHAILWILISGKNALVEVFSLYEKFL